MINKDFVCINPKEIDFHPILKDVENIFWFFMLSIRMLSDGEIQDKLREKNHLQGGYQCFNEMLDKFNNSVNFNIEQINNIATSKLNILKEMIFIGKAMSILAYDYVLASKYNAFINRDLEFQFLRHIRNGASHNNVFNLKDENGNWKIEENEIIEWNDKKISRELQGERVFNKFISIFDIFLLINQISEKLKTFNRLSK